MTEYEVTVDVPSWPLTVSVWTDTEKEAIERALLVAAQDIDVHAVVTRINVVGGERREYR